MRKALAIRSRHDRPNRNRRPQGPRQPLPRRRRGIDACRPRHSDRPRGRAGEPARRQGRRLLQPRRASRLHPGELPGEVRHLQSDNHPALAMLGSGDRRTAP